MLHPLSGTTQELQGRKLDVIGTYNNIHESIGNLPYILKTVEKELDIIYKQAACMASKLCIKHIISRTAFRQATHNNVVAKSRALIIPLLNIIVSEMKLQFKKVTFRASNFQRT